MAPTARHLEMDPRSALIVTVSLPPRLAAIRDGTDRMAALGVPAHVTVLFPFIPARGLVPSVRAALTGLAAAAAPFRARFDRLERRADMVWLVPEDQEPFLRLTRAVVARWPDHPPYGGIHEHLVAHLTLVETEDRSARERAAEAAIETGPFEVAVSELQVIAEVASGRWHRRWRLMLREEAEAGRRPTRVEARRGSARDASARGDP